MSRAEPVPLSVDGLVSGVAFVCAGLFPWTKSGPGSSLRGMELAAALRSGAGLPDWAPEAALAIVALSALGLGHIASAVSVGLLARRARFATGLVVLLALLWIASRYSADRWGLGLASAGLGASCAVVAGGLHEFRYISTSRGLR